MTTVLQQVLHRLPSPSSSVLPYPSGPSRKRSGHIECSALGQLGTKTTTLMIFAVQRESWENTSWWIKRPQNQTAQRSGVRFLGAGEMPSQNIQEIFKLMSSGNTTKRTVPSPTEEHYAVCMVWENPYWSSHIKQHDKNHHVRGWM